MLASSIIIIQIITLAISLFKYKQFDSVFMRTLILILASYLIVDVWDLITDSANIKVGHQYEVWLISTMLKLCLTFYLYYNLIKNKKGKTIVLVLSVLFVLLGFMSLAKKSVFHITLILGSFNVSVFAILYLKQLLYSNVVTGYKQVLPFWVTIAFLILHLPGLLFFLFMMYTHSVSLIKVMEVLLIVMNITILVGFLWSKKDNSYL